MGADVREIVPKLDPAELVTLEAFTGIACSTASCWRASMRERLDAANRLEAARLIRRTKSGEPREATQFGRLVARYYRSLRENAHRVYTSQEPHRE